MYVAILIMAAADPKFMHACCLMLDNNFFTFIYYMHNIIEYKTHFHSSYTAIRRQITKDWRKSVMRKRPKRNSL